MTTCKVIWEPDVVHVCQVDNGLIFRIIDLGSANICLDAVNFFIRPLSEGAMLGLGQNKSDTDMWIIYPLLCPHGERLRRTKLLISMIARKK